MADWVGIASRVITKHIRKVEDDMLRERILLAMMKKKGRLSFNNGGGSASGKSFEWREPFKRAPLIGYADADTLTFPRRDRYKVPYLDYRGYAVTEAFTKKEKLAGQGTEGIIKIVSDTIDLLSEDLSEGFGEELYVDGNATGNEKRIHGFESWFGATTTSGDGGKVDQPSDTYASLATDLGSFGGSWSSTSADWPKGTGDVSFDFWSPVILDSDDTVWGTSASWANFGDDMMRYAIIMGRRYKNNKGGLDLFLMGHTDYAAFLSLIDDKERINVQRGSTASPAVALGFNAVTFDGVDVMFEYGVPSNAIYGVNVDKLELMSMQSTLFDTEGPTYHEWSKSYNVGADFFGNLKCVNPRFQTKIRPT